jgi:hypothetical protein
MSIWYHCELMFQILARFSMKNNLHEIIFLTNIQKFFRFLGKLFEPYNFRILKDQTESK